jgi:hypothetical protein
MFSLLNTNQNTNDELINQLINDMNDIKLSDGELKRLEKNIEIKTNEVSIQHINMMKQHIMKLNEKESKNKVSVAAVTAPRNVKENQPLVCKKDSDGNFSCKPLYQQPKK